MAQTVIVSQVVLDFRAHNYLSPRRQASTTRGDGVWYAFMRLVQAGSGGQSTYGPALWQEREAIMKAASIAHIQESKSRPRLSGDGQQMRNINASVVHSYSGQRLSLLCTHRWKM